MRLSENNQLFFYHQKFYNAARTRVCDIHQIPTRYRSGELRTISVKEAASALGITPRAVTYRLEKGQLKGSLTKNDFGVPEWRIYPNKEILKGISENSQTVSGEISFEPNDVVEAETVESTERIEEPQSEQRTYNAEFQTIVEQCVRPLVEEVKAQALALAEKDRMLEEQGRQLRLLPDLRKQADEESKAAELRALEVEALKKQIEAIEAEKLQLAAKADEATVLANDLQLLKTKVEELQKPWWQKIWGS